MSAGTDRPAASRNVSAKSMFETSLAARAPGLDNPRPAHQKRCSQRFLEDPALVEPAMLAQVESLVSRVDDDGVAGQALIVEEFEQLPDTLVHRPDTSQVIVHVSLIFPAHEIVALEPGRPEGGIARFVVVVPGPALLGCQAVGRCELEVVAVIVLAIVMS